MGGTLWKNHHCPIGGIINNVVFFGSKEEISPRSFLAVIPSLLGKIMLPKSPRKFSFLKVLFGLENKMKGMKNSLLLLKGRTGILMILCNALVKGSFFFKRNSPTTTMHFWEDADIFFL